MNTETKTYQIGDVVHLNHDPSMLMTVTRGGEADVEVAWHDGNGRPAAAVYPVLCLTKLTDLQKESMLSLVPPREYASFPLYEIGVKGHRPGCLCLKCHIVKEKFSEKGNVPVKDSVHSDHWSCNCNACKEHAIKTGVHPFAIKHGGEEH
jgi:hypothetical protein